MKAIIEASRTMYYILRGLKHELGPVTKISEAWSEEKENIYHFYSDGLVEVETRTTAIEFNDFDELLESIEISAHADPDIKFWENDEYQWH